MVRKLPSPKSGCVRVVFEIPASLWANRVYLVGDFNEWNTSATPFERMRDGVWRVTLDLPAHRRYEFRYLADGVWYTDFHADGSTKGMGNALNSLLEAELPLRSLADAAEHGMVHEGASEKGMCFNEKPHL